MIYLYYLIPGIILLICLVILGWLVVRKFAELKTLDLEAMKSHHQKAVKRSLMEDRISRRTNEVKSKLNIIFGPYYKKVKALVSNLYQKILRLERKYKEDGKKEKPRTQEEKELNRQKVNLLLAEAKELVEKKDYHEAEVICIEALGLDAKNIDVYTGLCDVYLGLKDYDHAKETLIFAKELDPENDMIWRELGLLARNEDIPKEALKNFKQAVKIAPKNPKNLDLLIEQGIINKDKFEANNAYKQLALVNPDNQKLEEYKNQIEEL